MRYEQEPNLEVENWNINIKDGSYYLYLTVSNYGGGTASNLSCHIDFFDGYQIEPIDTGRATAYRVSEDGDDSYASSIRPNQLKVNFRSDPGRGHLDVFEGKGWHYSFKELVEKIEDSVDGPVYGEIKLCYSTQFEEYQEKRVSPKMEIEIEDGSWYTSSVDTIPKEEKYEGRNKVEFAESPPENA